GGHEVRGSVVTPGGVRDLGDRDRAPEPARRHAHLVPAPRRSQVQRLAVRPRFIQRGREARVLGVPEGDAQDRPGGGEARALAGPKKFAEPVAGSSSPTDRLWASAYGLPVGIRPTSAPRSAHEGHYGTRPGGAMAAVTKSCALCEICFALVVGVAVVALLPFPEQARAADGGRDRGGNHELAARRALAPVHDPPGL